MYDPKANPQDQHTIVREDKEFKLERDDVTGFFHIKTEFKLPIKYSDCLYTSVDEAKKAINAYLEEAAKVIDSLPKRKKVAA